MDIRARDTDRELLLEFSGEMDHHGARNALKEVEIAIDAAADGGQRCAPERAGAGPPCSGRCRHRAAGFHSITGGLHNENKDGK